jgi:hypothetical protein
MEKWKNGKFSRSDIPASASIWKRQGRWKAQNPYQISIQIPFDLRAPQERKGDRLRNSALVVYRIIVGV